VGQRQRITQQLKLGEEVERNFGAPFCVCTAPIFMPRSSSTVPPEIVHSRMKRWTWTGMAHEVAAHFCRRRRAWRADARDRRRRRCIRWLRETLFGPEKPRFTGRVAYRPSSRPHRLARPAFSPLHTKLVGDQTATW